MSSGAWAADAAAPGGPSSSVDPAQLAQTVTIYRDAWGAPHIDGQTDESVVFGFGYCQAEDYFWQLEDSFIMAIGRYAEVHGGKGLQKDILNRAFQVPQRSQADFEQLEPEVRSMCEAFVAGINYYLAKHPEVKPRLIEQFEPWHTVALARAVILEMGFSHTGTSRDQVPTNFGQPEAADGEAGEGDAAGRFSAEEADGALALGAAEAEVFEGAQAAVGSNAWALAPRRTREGHALLFINPHQPYYGFGQFYEGHLRSGEGWNFTGATFFGSPLPTLGHNEHCGWAFTVNQPNTSDSYIVTFDDPDQPLNYRYGDGYRTAETWTDTIKVRRGRRIDERTFTFGKTHHGPIVKKLDDQRYIAVRMGKFYDAFFPRQNLEMVRARNLDEFRRAMSRLELHIFNTCYADRDGNIYYLYNGVVPRRDGRFDWEKPLDGSDPATEWRGYHELAELPQALNPPSGFVQTCNASPYTTTDDGNPAIGDFPAYMVRERHDDKRRSKVSRMLLREMNDTTFEEWERAAFDTTVYWALTELPVYERQFAELKGSNAELAAKVAPYIEHLLDWDCVCTAESTQTTLCVEWYEQLYGFGYPAETLKGEFVGNVDKRFEALIRAADKLKALFGDWRVAWGDVYRIQRHANVAELTEIPFTDDADSLPARGLHGTLGVAFNMYFTPSINLPPLRMHKKRYAVVGNSYVSVVEFGPRVRGGSLLQYGTSGDAQSPHFFDQAKLLSEAKLKPQYFYWDDVEKNARRVYRPGEEVVAPAAQAGG